MFYVLIEDTQELVKFESMKEACQYMNEINTESRLLTEEPCYEILDTDESWG